MSFDAADRVRQARLDHDVTPLCYGNVAFDWGLAGPDGAWFRLYREFFHNDADIRAAKEYLRGSRDVVKISVSRVKPEPDKGTLDGLLREIRETEARLAKLREELAKCDGGIA